ncbi:hypothetical protein BDV93DRAFT_52083 [Ceratobasidium sp. AG-I]|nr:hypothetical protein BDV93DRAFT_52083 [Ceratobasidium sp. AG-I]
MEQQSQEPTLLRASCPARPRITSMFGGPQLASIPNPVSSSTVPTGLWGRLNTPVKMTLADLCSLALSHDSSTTTHVVSVDCYKERQGVRHEFLIVQIQSANLESRWLRLERAAQAELRKIGFRQRLQSSSSAYLPEDTAIISSTPNLIPEDAKQMEHVEFLNGHQPTLFIFASLLALFMRESVFYTLPSENCWFFCSVVIENLSKNFGGNVKPRNRSLGRESRQRIERQFREMICDIENGTLRT